MYERFYGLHELPFELTANPKFLFLTAGHREALSNLQYGLSASKALTVLIGEAGTGKTTLVRAAVESDRCGGVDTVQVNNPALTRAEFIELLARRFGLSDHAAASKAALLGELEAVLIDRRSRGQITALVVDEAQSLSAELLEEIRLLANIETATEKLLPLVLSGQPELRERLNEPGLRQLKQRVTLRCEIAPFTLEETASYIATRIRVAGGDSRRLFTRDAVILIHERSQGIPRVINVLCDNALVTGFGLARRPVDRAAVLDVLRDFDLAARDVRDAGVAADTQPTPEAVTLGEEPATAVTPAASSDATTVVADENGLHEVEPEMFVMGGRARRFRLFGSGQGRARD